MADQDTQQPYEPAPEKLSYRPRFDRIRKPDSPERWRHLLHVVTTPDRTQPRSQERYAPPIKDQGQEGSCTAQGGTSSAETGQAIAGQPVTPLCRNELYLVEREDEGQTPQNLSDTGAAVTDSVNSQIRHGGIGPERQWPYDANPRELPPAGYPSARYLYVAGLQPIDLSTLDGAINGVLQACDAKQPLVLGMTWRTSYFTDFQQTGVLRPNPTGSVAGGHEVFSACVYVPPTASKPETGRYGLVGWDNSWGQTSPARTDLHPDARAGMFWTPMEMLGGDIDEVYAVTPKIAPQPTPTPEVLTLSVSVPTSGQAGVAVTMSASVSGVTPGDTALITWDFGDGTARAAGTTVGHTYATAGSYTVTVRAADSQTGAQSPASAGPITIAAPTPPPAGNCHDHALGIMDGMIGELGQDTWGKYGTIWGGWYRSGLDQNLGASGEPGKKVTIPPMPPAPKDLREID